MNNLPVSQNETIKALMDEIDSLKKENDHLREWQITEKDIREKENLKSKVRELKRELVEANINLRTFINAYSRLQKSEEIETLSRVVDTVILREKKKEVKEEPSLKKKVIKKVLMWI